MPSVSQVIFTAVPSGTVWIGGTILATGGTTNTNNKQMEGQISFLSSKLCNYVANPDPNTNPDPNGVVHFLVLSFMLERGYCLEDGLGTSTGKIFRRFSGDFQEIFHANEHQNKKKKKQKVTEG